MFRIRNKKYMAILFLFATQTGCQHWCVNYVECDDARVKGLQKQVAALKKDNSNLQTQLAKTKLTALEINEARCEDVR